MPALLSTQADQLRGDIPSTPGLSQTELARLFGVRRRALAEWTVRGIPAARQAKAASLAGLCGPAAPPPAPRAHTRLGPDPRGRLWRAVDAHHDRTRPPRGTARADPPVTGLEPVLTLTMQRGTGHPRERRRPRRDLATSCPRFAAPPRLRSRSAAQNPSVRAERSAPSRRSLFPRLSRHQVD